jgi:hypothetical protein
MKVRKAKGQGIVEGVAALWLIVSITVCLILFILGAGTAIYYKMRLAAVVDSAAEYAAQSTTWLGAVRPDYSESAVKEKTRQLVDVQLGQLGLPVASEVETDINLRTVPSYVTVKVKVVGLRIISGNVLPTSISLMETGVHGLATDGPIAVLGLGIINSDGTGQGVYVPSYGAGQNTPGPSALPGGKYPFYQIVGGPGTQLAGPFQNGTGGGPFRSY